MREMMKQKKVKLVEIQRLGNLLGISRADLDALLLQRSLEKESVELSLGPPWYGSGFYGAVSIYDLIGRE